MSYQILSAQTVIDYLTTLPAMQALFSDFAALTVEEIGDGNVNFVYRIKDNNSGQSVILKQAVPYLRCVGESFPLSRHRMNIEIMALETAKKYSPAHVPNIYYSSTEQSVVIMQDLADHAILRGQLIQGTVFPNFANHISTYMADTLFGTSDLHMTSEDKKQCVVKFTNTDLCKLSEDFVFTHPFEDNANNNYNPKLPQTAIDKVQKNGAVKVAVSQMRHKFMNNAQALIHGDLHTGSIMTNQTETYVIDPEFAFYGPMGFDVGAVIGNLYIAYFSHAYLSHASQDSIDYRAWLLDTIEQIWTQFSDKFTTRWLEHETQSEQLQWQYDNGIDDLKVYINSYLSDLFADTIGFAACKMMRRVLGIAKVADFADITDLDARANIETNIINMATHMVVNRSKFNTIDELNALAKETNTLEKITG
ncbi:MAG: S-methyl-5-thioribose kinase [Algicola sp.]|nr:S-methyl-5-thioribose kinase [Algicola sp.]